jgi:hypothetical protein
LNKLKCIILKHEPNPDRFNRTRYTLLWENDLICNCRPTPVRGQVQHADIKECAARMSQSFDVEIRDATPALDSRTFDWKNVPDHLIEKARKELEILYQKHHP